MRKFYWENITRILQAPVRKLRTQWLWRYNAERPNMALDGITPYQKLAKAA